jgi:hypothetical protein
VVARHAGVGFLHDIVDVDVRPEAVKPAAQVRLVRQDMPREPVVDLAALVNGTALTCVCVRTRIKARAVRAGVKTAQKRRRV